VISLFHAKLQRPLKILGDDEVQRIHSATLEVLENVGVRFEDEAVLRLLDDQGAHTDPKTHLAKIPPSLVEEAIKKCPKKVKLCGRTKNHDLTLGDGKVYFTAGANALHLLDMETGIRRVPTSEDCAQLSRVFDALDHVHAILPAVIPQDVPQSISDRVKCKISYENCEKHYLTDVYGRESCRDLIRMAEAVSGGPEELRRRPIISINPSITSPLTWGRDSTEPLFEAAHHGVPVILDCMPNAGATSPITLAGSVVQQNAESLSFVTLAQLTNPGTPTIPYTSPGITNMRTGGVIYGAVEVAIQCAAMSQIYSHYQIPYIATVGLTDSKMHDEQTAYERSVSVLMTALAGPSMISTQAGALNSLTDTSFEQTLIDDEILGMVSRAMSGMRVDEETLAVDVIAKVGPGHHFLAQKHTNDMFLKEHYLPRLADRESRNKWEKDGSNDVVKRARERVKEILRTHQPTPLSDDVRKKLDFIVEEAKRKRQSD
jgi:trimethylamine--corrinoid protein Co-methyltransferase